MIKIDELRNYCAERNDVIITQHVYNKLRERPLQTADIFAGIQSGEIIEQYPADYPFPSCLVLGKAVSGTPVHIVCGVGDDKLWIISAYVPSVDKWEDDYKTRKVTDK